MKRLLCILGAVAFAASAAAQTANYPESQLTPAYIADSGSANALAGSVSTCPAALATGQFYKVLPAHNTTSTTPTINVCGFGTKTITKNGQSALSSGDMVTTAIAVLLWDGADMELQNPQTSAGGVTSISAAGIMNLSSATGAVTVVWSGTAGGIVYFPTSSTTASSGALTAHGPIISEGASAPVTMAVGGSNFPLLGGGASSDPAWGTVAVVTSASTGCVVYAVSSAGLTCNGNLVLNSGGAFTTYDGLTTAGLGLDAVLGVSDVTAQTASQTTVNLLASAAAGHYKVQLYLDQNALCTTGLGTVYATVSWTDASHAHQAQTIPLTLANTAISSANGYVDVAIPLWSAASQAITYTTTYGGCSGSGTASYDLHAEVDRAN